MMESLCDLSTAEGRMNTFITHPEQGGPFPVVLFYMDSLGMREELRDMAWRVAAAGYLVVLPDLHYQRTGQQTATPGRRLTKKPRKRVSTPQRKCELARRR